MSWLERRQGLIHGGLVCLLSPETFQQGQGQIHIDEGESEGEGREPLICGQQLYFMEEGQA